MPRLHLCVLLSAGGMLAASLAVAQPAGSLETWVDGCEATDPDLQALLENEALIVDTNRLASNLDGTYSLTRSPFTSAFGAQFPLCSTARFFLQPQVTAPTLFRSAVQVGPDLILTAWHSLFDMHPDHRVVFGVHDRQVGDACLPADFDQIPASHVFTIQAVVADGYSHQGNLDYVLLKLDRVIDHDYPRVRRSGRWVEGEAATLIGHPERTAAKVDQAGVMGGTEIFGGREWPQFANVHVLDGSSGSMSYNRSQRLLETVVRGGAGVSILPDPAGEGCFGLVHQNGHFTTNASVRYFAEHIPAFELVVDSLDPVVNVTTVGGVLPHPSTSRTVMAPATATSAIDYQIIPPPPFAPGQPTLNITPGAPLTGTLAPGASFAIQEEAHIHGVGCGRYERSYEVRDLTHGFQDVARHVFEIGLREFTVSEQRTEPFEDLAAPWEGTVVYTLRNPRVDPVTVVVSANQDWVSLNGVASPGAPTSIELQLQPGDVVPVTLGVAAFLEPDHYPQEFGAVVSFEFAAGTSCRAFEGPITRDLEFVSGHETFSGQGGLIPNGGALGLTVSVDTQETFCVGDLDVGVRVNNAPANQILATLTAPSLRWTPPAQAIVWHHGSVPSAPTAPLIGTLNDEAEEEGGLEPFEPLSTFDAEQGRGIWQLNLVKDLSATPAFLASWNLQFTAAACPP